MYSDVQLFIDGQWCDGASGNTLPIANPATGAVIARLAHADRADLDHALDAADRGFRVWRKTRHTSATRRYARRQRLSASVPTTSPA